jgi:hypothetical protein
MNAPTMTPAEKRTATRRANKAKRDAYLARAAEERANAVAKPAAEWRPMTADDEAVLLHMLTYAQTKLAECRADMAKAARQDRQQMATQAVVALADWRRASA